MFSVIIPIYNHQAFLAEAVSSALRSPLVSEVLLLDDGSRDASARLAASWVAIDRRVRNLTTPEGGNRGAHRRLNELVHAATCEWLAVLNSDDVFVAGRFETIVAQPAFVHSDFIFGNLLLMNQASSLVGAKRGPFDTDAAFPPEFDTASMVAAGEFLELLSHQNYLATTSNMVFRKGLHTRVGGFQDYRYVHDWDFALRAMALGRPLYVQRYLTAYRMHPHNTIIENRKRIVWEAMHVFERFSLDFPQLVAAPKFRMGLETNVDVGTLFVNAKRA